MSSSSRRRASRGQALVVFVIAFAALLGFVVLALEGGQLYLQRRAVQRAADMAALAAAWAYYQGDFATAAFPASPDLVDPPSRARQVVVANGLPAGDLSSLQYVDAAGAVVDTSGCPVACPRPWQVRGVTVSLSHDVSLQLGQAFGAGFTSVAATATAMIGSSTGALHELPLALANSALPRVAGAAQCAAPQASTGRYTLDPDCRPVLGAPLVLYPHYEGAAAVATLPLSAPFETAARVDYYVLHDSPGCAAGATLPAYSACDAASYTARYGEGYEALETDTQAADADLVATCPPGPACAVDYYVELARNGPPYLGTDADGMATGLGERLAGAPAGQSCAAPSGGAGFLPLTPDNPRLLRLPVTYAPPAPSGANVASIQVGETVMFCVEAVVTDTAAASPSGFYAVEGYTVNEPTPDPTLLSRADPYAGRDAVIRLVP